MDKLTKKLYEITDYLELLLLSADSSDLQLDNDEKNDLENLIDWCKEKSGQDKIEEQINNFFEGY